MLSEWSKRTNRWDWNCNGWKCLLVMLVLTTTGTWAHEASEEQLSILNTNRTMLGLTLEPYSIKKTTPLLRVTKELNVCLKATQNLSRKVSRTIRVNWTSRSNLQSLRRSPIMGKLLIRQRFKPIESQEPNGWTHRQEMVFKDSNNKKRDFTKWSKSNKRLSLLPIRPGRRSQLRSASKKAIFLMRDLAFIGPQMSTYPCQP